LDEGFSIIEKTEERVCEAELCRSRGVLFHQCGRSVEAEGEFKQALSIARRQDARMWELRAATGLAQLWRDQGKRHEARDLLAPVHGWFTEGFDTRDLKEAKALLDELAS